MSLLRTNSCYFVGTLVEVKELRELTYGDNREAVTATIVLKSVIGEGENEVENLFELHNFTSKYTKSGSINKNYNTILGLKDFLNKRVVISGATIDVQRFWAKNTNQLVASPRYNFNLIRAARENENDGATFELGGFVYRELVERTNNDGDVMYYVLQLAQANYKEDNMQVIDLVVDKDNLAAVKKIEEVYEQGATVTVSGKCSTIVLQEQHTEEVAFGEPIVKVFTKTDRKMIITGGSEPVTGEGEYEVSAIKTLNEAYVRSGNEIKDKALNDTNIQEAQEAPKKTPSRKAALAGLI